MILIGGQVLAKLLRHAFITPGSMITWKTRRIPSPEPRPRAPMLTTQYVVVMFAMPEYNER